MPLFWTQFKDTHGLEQITDVNNIKFISKISNSRVCAYLTKSEIVDALLNKTIKVQDHILKIRLLIEKNKRVVISNVCPVIPNEVILDALKNICISVVSSLLHIRGSTSNPGRTHIRSLRRQVYVKEEDIAILPVSLQISYENTILVILGH